ncbi:MAG: hypothetical protein ACKV2T_22975 [Kofleriaceae bacterium]
MRILLLSLLAVPSMFACGGGGSDVSSSKKLTDLSTAEQQDLCEELSFERMVTCQGTTITIRTKNCTDLSPPPASCMATVGDARACVGAQMSATDAELCSGNELAACETLIACGGV